MEKYYKELSESFAKAVDGLKAKKVAVIGHVRPDGDCIGSQVALTRVLRNLGIDAIACNQHAVPPSCSSFIKDTPFFLTTENLDQDRVLVTTDCADFVRLGGFIGDNFKDVYLNIDHHISNTNYATYNLIDADSSATGEVLAGIFYDNGYDIDDVTAQALYVGIATDTGQFRFGSTTRKTFAIACRLMDDGANPAEAALELYERESPQKLALLQRFLASFKYYFDGKVCLGRITDEDWSATGAIKEDTEGLVDYARSIDGVDIGIFIEEHDGQIKGSFRAKDPIHRVDLLAKEFNGGGHACAAGFNPQKPFDELLPEMLNTLEKHFENLGEIE